MQLVRGDPAVLQVHAHLRREEVERILGCWVSAALPLLQASHCCMVCHVGFQTSEQSDGEFPRLRQSCPDHSTLREQQVNLAAAICASGCAFHGQENCMACGRQRH